MNYSIPFWDYDIYIYNSLLQILYLLKTESLCIVLCDKYSTRESLYISRGVSTAQVIRVLYKTMYWA